MLILLVKTLLKIKDKPLDKTMMMFTLKDSIPGEPLLLHEEPIYLDDKIIGKQLQEIIHSALIKIYHLAMLIQETQ